MARTTWKTVDEFLLRCAIGDVAHVSVEPSRNSLGIVLMPTGSDDDMVISRSDSDRLFGEKTMPKNYYYQIELYLNMRLNDHKYRLQRKGLV